MPKIYRTLTFASFMLGVASFVVDLGSFVRDTPLPTLSLPQLDTGESRGPAKPACDLRLYESAKARLRSARRDPMKEWEWLGTDRYYDYFYDYQTDAIACYERKATGPMVSPQRIEEQDRPQSNSAVLACLAVIGLSGIGMMVIRRMRQKRLPPEDN
jgi:hypothetical protein